ncbi:PAS domain-containing protein [Microbaculum sp. FT89]|uniref:PAS domain-containing protein n=1 Tax=Microbaculum sp. FT89 TaxID=3447298 RepID=UPI003F52C3CF
MWKSPEFRGGRHGTSIRHAANRTLYRYWDGLRGERPAPMRHEIEPTEIGAMLSDTFILEVTADREYAYRLAGTRVCGYFGHELKGTDWLDGWSDHAREALSTLMRTVVSEGTGALVGFTGQTERGHACPFETLVLPLVNRGASFTRMIGATMPLDQPYWLGAYPVVNLDLTALDVLWPNNSSHFRPPPRKPGAAGDFPLLRKGHLALYDGGRTD